MTAAAAVDVLCRSLVRRQSSITTRHVQRRPYHGQEPRYLADHVTPAIEVASRHRLRSANRHRLIVPRCRLNTYNRRSLVRRSGIHCQMNSEIRRVMSTASNSSLKTILFSSYWCDYSALEVIFNVMRSINPRFTYLLTYLRRLLDSFCPHSARSQRTRCHCSADERVRLKTSAAATATLSLYRVVPTISLEYITSMGGP